MSPKQAPPSKKVTKHGPKQPAGRISRPVKERPSTNDRSNSLNPDSPKGNSQGSAREPPGSRERAAKKAHDEFLNDLARDRGEGFAWSDD